MFSGYAYITSEGDVTYYVKRPVGLLGENVKYIRKPEQINEMLSVVPNKVAFELDTLSVNDYNRLAKVFASSEIVDGSGILRACRAVKTPYEVEKMKEMMRLSTSRRALFDRKGERK